MDKEPVPGEDAPVVDEIIDDAPPVETPPVEDHEPAPDHPRFKEIYGKMKVFERQIAEGEETNKEMAEHNKALSDALERLGKVEDGIAESNRPDPLHDPEAHEKWLEEKITRKVLKDTKPAVQSTPTPAKDPFIDAQEKVLAEVYPDYYEHADVAMADMKGDVLLQKEILGAANPPLAAYKYSIAKKERADANRNTGLDQGHVEGGEFSPGRPGGGELTPAEKKAAEKFGISHKDYKAQKDAIASGRE